MGVQYTPKEGVFRQKYLRAQGGHAALVLRDAALQGGDVALLPRDSALQGGDAAARALHGAIPTNTNQLESFDELVLVSDQPSLF